MDNRRKTQLTIIDQGLVSGMNFITGLLLARFLGLDGYGQFVLAYGIILFISGVQVALVISPMMVKAPTLSEEESADYFLSVGKLQLLFSIASYFAVLLIGSIAQAFYPEIDIFLFIAPLGIATIFFTIQDYIRRYFFVNNRSYYALINDIISYCSQALMILIFGIKGILNANLSLWIIAITSAAAVCFALVFQAAHVRPHNIKKRYHNFRYVLVDHWQFGKWLIARNITYWGGSQFTIYLSAALLSVAMVGAISATRNIVGIANILFLAMENFVPSRAAKKYHISGIKGLHKYLIRVSFLGGIITACILLIAVASPEFWLNLIYSDEYKGFESLVYWWAAYYLVGFFHRPITSGLRALGKTREIFYSTLVGTLLALFASYPAIDFAGLTGAMFTMLTVQTIILLSLIYYFFRHR